MSKPSMVIQDGAYWRSCGCIAIAPVSQPMFLGLPRSFRLGVSWTKVHESKHSLGLIPLGVVVVVACQTARRQRRYLAYSLPLWQGPSARSH